VQALNTARKKRKERKPS